MRPHKIWILSISLTSFLTTFLSVFHAPMTPHAHFLLAVPSTWKLISTQLTAASFSWFSSWAKCHLLEWLFPWPLQLKKLLLPSLTLRPIVFFYLIHNTYYRLQLSYLIIYMFIVCLLSPEWNLHGTKNTSVLFTSLMFPAPSTASGSLQVLNNWWLW